MTPTSDHTWHGCLRVVELVTPYLRLELHEITTRIHDFLAARAVVTDSTHQQDLERALNLQAQHLRAATMLLGDHAVWAIESAARGKLPAAVMAADHALRNDAAAQLELLKVSVSRPEHVVAVAAAAACGLTIRNKVRALVCEVEQADSPSWPHWLLDALPTLVQQKQAPSRQALDQLANVTLNPIQAENLACFLRDGMRIGDGIRAAQFV